MHILSGRIVLLFFYYYCHYFNQIGITIVKHPRTIIWMGRDIRNKLLLLLSHICYNEFLVNTGKIDFDV